MYISNPLRFDYMHSVLQSHGEVATFVPQSFMESVTCCKKVKALHFSLVPLQRWTLSWYFPRLETINAFRNHLNFMALYGMFLILVQYVSSPPEDFDT